MEKKIWHISSKTRWDQESWVNKDKFILYSETVDSCSDSNKIKLIVGYLLLYHVWKWTMGYVLDSFTVWFFGNLGKLVIY